MAAYVFYWQGEEGRIAASHKIDAALSKLNSDFSKMQIANRDFANKLSRDSTLIDAINKSDRSGIASLFAARQMPVHFLAFCLPMMKMEG